MQNGRNKLEKRTLRYSNSFKQFDPADLPGSGGGNGSDSRMIDMSAMHDMFHQSSNPISSGNTATGGGRVGTADDKIMMNFRNTFQHNPTTAQLLPPTSSSQRMSAGTLGYHGPAISAADRLPMDPLLKRTLWSKAYKQGEQDKKEMSKSLKKELRHQRQQQILAETERKAMRDFEKHLVLAKIQA